jgi:hypothetical protein
MILGGSNDVNGVNAYIDGEFNNVFDFFDFDWSDLFWYFVLCDINFIILIKSLNFSIIYKEK